jgi:hypothetical protein
MGRSRRVAAGPAVTADRAGRLYKLLLQIRTAKPRPLLIKRLDVTMRGFYRDLEFLRGLGVTVENTGDTYRLGDPLGDALARLPFPDPGLNLRDALQLARGRTDAHRKLRARVAEVVGSKAAHTVLATD